METGITEKTLRSFLLGDCSEDESEAVGVSIIEEADFGERLISAEDFLIEEFLEGRLSEDERELFLTNFMTTPSRLERLEQTSILARFAKKNAASDIPTADEKPGLFDVIAGFFGGRGRLVLTAAALVVVACGAFWLFGGWRNGMSPLEREYAALNSKDLTNSPEIVGVSTKSLAPDVFRGPESSSKLRLSGLTERVLFRLALPVKTADTVDVEISSAGKVVFRQQAVKVYANPNGAEVKLLIPQSILGVGTYKIKLSGDATYVFSIE